MTAKEIFVFERQTGYEAFYIGVYPAATSEIASGLRWALSRIHNLSDLMVVAPTRRHFRNDKALQSLPKGVRTETPRTLQRSYESLPPVVLV